MTRLRPAPSRLGPWLLVVLAACAQDPQPVTPDAGTADDALPYRPCAPASRLGGFALRLEDGFSAVEGRVLDGVVPGNVREITGSEGACVLLEGRNFSCDPPCASGQTCGADGCIPYPRARSVGVVTVRGLKDPLTLEPSRVGSYSSAGQALSHPAFLEDAPLSLEAGGAELPGFTLQARGVAALEAPEDAVALERGQPVRLRWVPGGGASARIKAVLDLAHHGGIAASVECDGLEDSGAFDVPAALVARLLDLGLAGFPAVTLTRQTATSLELGPGCVELDALSEVARPIAVPGLLSCTQDEDCPGSARCRFDLTCGE
jgi:hypothetical protein